MSTNYLDRAMIALARIGVQFPPQPAPVLRVLKRTTRYDATRVAAIAATLQQSSTFNQAVRDRIEGVDISTRYVDIAAAFDSICDDAMVWPDPNGCFPFEEGFDRRFRAVQPALYPSLH